MLSNFSHLNSPQMKAYFESLLSNPDSKPNEGGNLRSSSKRFSESKPLHDSPRNYNFYDENKDPKSNNDFESAIKHSEGNEQRPLNFAEMAKKIGEFTKSAMSNREKDFQEEYLHGLNTASKILDCSRSRNPFLRGINHMVFFNIQFAILAFNFLSLVDMIWITDYRLGDHGYASVEDLTKLEWAISTFFGFEVLLNILGCDGGFLRKICEIFTMNNITNILLISEIISTTIYSQNFVRLNNFFIFVYVLRSIKLIKLRVIIQQSWKKFKKLLTMNNSEILIDSWNSQSELKYFIYNSAIDIIIAIFIEATAFMAVDEALDYQAFSSNYKQFSYIAACYYSIVSLTTIGYGDITPVTWQSRMFVVVVLFFNISVLSSFLSAFTDKIYQISPFIRNFYYKNHIVIVGDLPITFMKYFLNELYLCDSIITTNLRNQNTANPKNPSKMILVQNENPTKELQTWLEAFSETNVDINYLKSNIFDHSWHKQANLASARHIFAFSMNFQESQEQALEKDKAMVYNMQNIVTLYPNIDITLVLSSDFGENLINNSSFSSINIVSAKILNESFMANSLENPGLNTFLTHLFTLREKITPKGTELSRLEEYSISMGQELYPIKLPAFFIGKSFQEIMKISYFCSIDLAESFQIDYSEVDKTKEIFRNKKSGLLLLGIETKEEDLKTSRFLINPINYKIRPDDIGYVVGYDLNHVRAITSLSEHSPSYNTYQKNMNFFKRLKLEQDTHIHIEKMAQNIRKNLANWEMKKTEYLKKTHKDLKQSEISQMKIPYIFDLRDNNSPKGIFKKHIIIKGPLSRLGKLAQVIRAYGQRPIVLFSDKEVNQSQWHKIKESFKNIYYVIGTPTNIKHVMQLDPQKALKILILSDNEGNFVQDSESIVFTRIISDVFELSNFLTELTDERNMRYLSINPKYPNLDYYFWPFFVRGGVHFSSFAMSIVAKTLINKNWLSFVQNFAHSSRSGSGEEEEVEDKGNEEIHTMIITKEAALEFQLFGHLQFALMAKNPPTIAIAVLKTKTDEQNHIGQMIAKKPRQSVGTQDKTISNEISRIMDNFYGSEFLMTNPSFLMPLEEGDKVLIVGALEAEKNTHKKLIKLGSSQMLSSLRKKRSYSHEEKEVFEVGNPKQFKKELSDVMENLNETVRCIVNNWDDLKEKINGNRKN